MVECTKAAVSKRVVQQIACIDLNARSKVQAKRVNMLTTFANRGRKERHHSMESKCIRKERLITPVEVTTGDSRGIEWKAHMWKARANELSIDSRVMGKGGAE